MAYQTVLDGFDSELADVRDANASVISSLATRLTDNDCQEELDEIHANLKDSLGARAANACAEDERPDDAIDAAYAYVTDHVSNGAFETQVAGVLTFFGAAEGARQIEAMLAA